ncbi:MAG: ornithine cyclodeaminase family protein [Nitrososphaerota archaeon]|nr:ornithine cyclodeaminase family protein [Nitrososphaerota archaeon]
MKQSIEVIRQAFVSDGKEQTSSIPRSRIYLRGEQSDEDFWLNVKAGAISNTGYSAIRVDGGLTKSLQGDRVDVSRKSGLVFLYSLRTGELLAIFHNDYLQKLRVGATTAVATDALANPEVKNMAILGSGRQARSNLDAVCSVRRPTNEIRAYSPNRDHLARFCLEMSAQLGQKVTPCNSSSEAVKDADIVTVATNSKTPTCKGADLSPNAHVNSILSSDRLIQGKDVDDATYERADIIVVNSRNQIYLDDQHPLRELSDSPRNGKRIVELGDLLVSKNEGRLSWDDFTLYDNNVGMGIQFTAVCGYVFNRAIEMNLGKEWPNDLFDLNVYRSGQADIGNSYNAFGKDTYKSSI